MEKITIRSIFINEKKKDGTYYEGKWGRYKVGVLTAEDGRKMSKFITKEDDPVLSWKSGDEVEVIVGQNGDFLNFELPKDVDLLSEKFGFLADRVAYLEKILSPYIKKYEAEKLSKESL